MVTSASVQRVGLFGGSFNPVHFGHLISARSVAEQLGLSQVVLIPAASPPHKQPAGLISAEHRLEMTRLAVRGDPLFTVSDVELRRAGPSYTFDTVTSLQQALGEAVKLSWIIGADSLAELPTWYRIHDLIARVDIVTVMRPGPWAEPAAILQANFGAAETARLLGSRLSTPNIEISATDIRERVARGASIRYLTPAPVIAYIDEHGLYRG